MLAKCCGASACYECLKEYVSSQIAASEDAEPKLYCPFCKKHWPDVGQFLVHNQSLHRFWEDELGKDTDRLSPEEKEEQQR